MAAYLASLIMWKSSSPWSAPVLFVAKKNRKLRFCFDYRLLNKVTVKNRFPLPPIDVQLDKLYGKKFFTSIDLQSAYNQVRMVEKDIPKVAFTTPLGILIFSDTIEEHIHEIKEVLKLRISNGIDEGDDFFLLAATAIITVADHVL